ncbi:MAG: aminotransferase class I/II-fold pyridoxal phosphate-dependent enzyme, partial [Bacteroidales bacterium]|nr:aminotransferase class I/II-fold pyridoxal phosphate-dependent enzyme [Bacteroidales bacterium]
LVSGINALPRLSCQAPEATFYLMVNISQTGMRSEEFAIALLQSQHVAVVPGITYGKNCDNYVRMAFTLDEQKIREGIERISTFITQLP